MKQFSLILVLCLFLFGCRKDPSINNITTTHTGSKYDTLKPLSYLPVYPGSFWNYLENDTDTVIFNTSPTYLKHSYLKSQRWSGNTAKDYSDTVYVPFLNNRPIYQYSEIEHIAPPFGDYYQLHPVLSEKIGTQFQRKWVDGRLSPPREMVTVKQKTVNNHNDSILILEGRWSFYWSTISIQEYTKNIGLTSFVKIDTVTMDTIYKLRLTNCFINK